MVKVILDTYIENSTEREIHIRYDKANPNDQFIMTKLRDLLCNEQPLCSNCVNYYREGNFCGYCAVNCRIHGNLDGWDHPNHDGDGSKCPDYVKRVGPIDSYVRIQSEEERIRMAPFEEKLKKLKEANNDT